ncbi:MAG: lipoate--protein ligase family protein [Candidatus Omnitrophota bacterium]
MRVEDLSFEDPRKNLDYDDGLLREAEAGDRGEVLRFWESPSFFAVLGRTCDPDDDLDAAACASAGVAVLRRSSGGGTVLQGPGCLNFSLVLAKARHADMVSIGRSYAFILGRVLKALKACGVDAAFRPVCDLVAESGEMKFSGNAQRRGRAYVLHHGTILYDFDLALISACLKMPPRMPEYRRGRRHADFVANVGIDIARFKRELAHAWGVI